jgi:3-oxoacyl-[acyl-carrier-protein] synthase-3
MTGVGLLAVTAERPARLVTNDDLALSVQTTDEWVRTRTGIATRRLAGDNESVVSLGIRAGAKALAAAGVDPLQVGLVLLASCSMPSPLPGGAAQIASGVGAASAGAADVNAGCAGFCYALSMAADTVRAGSAEHVLVVGSERLSDYVNWDDRTTCVLFADGAGAAVVGDSPHEYGVGPVVWGSDGTGSEFIAISPDDRTITMQGRAVYRWATAELAPVARAACQRAGISPADLAAFVPHQANLRIVHALAEALQLPESCVIADDVVDAGNTSAASVPLALARLLDEGRVGSGQPVLLLGFGSGLTWAGQVVLAP